MTKLSPRFTENMPIREYEINYSKGVSDTKNYSLIELENGLRVLLVSEQQVYDDDNRLKESQRAAVALSVQVGTSHDPVSFMGGAHFLEHVLFMGSEKYSIENEYDEFISAHGGSTNAFTECEYSCFVFDVLPQSLEPAIDRYSWMVIAILPNSHPSDSFPFFINL